MSTLRVDALALNDTGNASVSIANSWNVSISTSGATRVIVTSNGRVGIGTTTPTANLDVLGTIISTGMNTSTINATTISLAGSIGTSGQVVTSNGTNAYWSSPATPAKNYSISGSMQKASFADSTTYYFGSQPQATLITTADVQRVYIPSSGNISSVYVSAYNSGGVVGTGEASTLYLRINNTTDYTITSSLVLNMASSAALYYSNTTLSVPVVAGDYFEFKQTCPAWVTNPTNILYGWQVYIT